MFSHGGDFTSLLDLSTNIIHQNFNISGNRVITNWTKGFPDKASFLT